MLLLLKVLSVFIYFEHLEGRSLHVSTEIMAPIAAELESVLAKYENEVKPAVVQALEAGSGL
jgi:hypothetical protein